MDNKITKEEFAEIAKGTISDEMLLEVAEENSILFIRDVKSIDQILTFLLKPEKSNFNYLCYVSKIGPYKVRSSRYKNGVDFNEFDSCVDNYTDDTIIEHVEIIRDGKLSLAIDVTELD